MISETTGVFTKKHDVEDLDVLSKTSGAFSQKKQHATPRGWGFLCLLERVY